MAFDLSSLLPIRGTDTVILDTDIASDCDDVGALAVLAHGLARTGAKLGAVINDTDNVYGCGATDAVLRYYGFVPAVGMTTDHGFMDTSMPQNVVYNKAVSEQFSEAFRTGTLEIRPALELYREVLRGAADGSVVLITIGFLNTAAEILREEPELFAAKVRCVVSMAGNFEHPENKEWNVFQNAPASKFFFENCPVPVIFDGFELGISFETGFEEAQPENPAYVAYQLYCKGMRYSFDPSTVDFAFLGLGEDWTTGEAFDVKVLEDGTLEVTENPNGNCRALRFCSDEARERIRLRLNRFYATKP
jgi:hypothetical protein